MDRAARLQVDRIIYIPPKMFAAKTDIPCMLMYIPYILYERGAQPRSLRKISIDVEHTQH